MKQSRRQMLGAIAAAIGLPSTAIALPDSDDGFEEAKAAFLDKRIKEASAQMAKSCEGYLFQAQLTSDKPNRNGDVFPAGSAAYFNPNTGKYHVSHDGKERVFNGFTGFSNPWEVQDAYGRRCIPCADGSVWAYVITGYSDEPDRSGVFGPFKPIYGWQHFADPMFVKDREFVMPSVAVFEQMKVDGILDAEYQELNQELKERMFEDLGIPPRLYGPGVAILDNRNGLKADFQ